MILSTDSTANLPQNYYEELGIKMIPMQIILDSQIYDDLSADLPCEEFYNKMKAGATPKTAQINAEQAKEYFNQLLSTGEDVLHISFSTTLSGNTDTMMRIAKELNETHSNKLVVYNSMGASIGEGMLVLIANDLKTEGKSIDEIVLELDKVRDHSCSYFIVDQLKYLVRGGRIGKFSGLVGTLLNIKPVLHVDTAGNLVSYKKVISRKKAIQELADICATQITDKKRIFITHTMCIEDAELLASKVEETVGVKPVITELTQVIGCHTGPGLLAIFFLGNKK